MKRAHPKEDFHTLKRRGSVRCPRCRKSVNRGPQSNPVDELFLKAHQARSQYCQSLPMPIVDPDDELRDDDTHDHVDFEANRYDYDYDDDNDEAINFELEDQRELPLSEFNFGTRQLDDFTVGPVQLEENPDLRDGNCNPYNLAASEDILKIQREHLRLFEDKEIINKFKDIRTPKGKIHKKKWEDLLDIYALGINFDLSRDQKNELLSSFAGIIERNGCSAEITIPKDWKSLNLLFSSSYETLFEKKQFEYALPRDFFGEFEEDGVTPLRKMVGLALDVKTVLAEGLLGIDPSHFSTVFQRDNGILAGFESGDTFQKISEDDKLFEPHPEHGYPISLCLTIRSDETTCNTSRTEKEMAIVISILNAKPPHYKMLFLGYVPIHKPYSDPILHELLGKRGTTYICFYIKA